MYFEKYKHLLPASLLLGVTFFAYLQGVEGGFVFDDGVNLIRNPRFVFSEPNWENVLAASFSSGSSYLQRPISMFSLALNQYFDGLGSARPYKITNIAIHCAAGLMVYLLGCQLLGMLGKHQRLPASGKSIALLAAGLWMLHPLNLTSVLYVVQRMTELSALFSLASMSAYIYGRQKMIQGNPGFGYAIAFGIGSIFLILGVLSKENAILAPGYWFLLEIWWLNFEAAPGKKDKILVWIYAAGASLGIIAILVYWLNNPDLLSNSYRYRGMQIEERLLTEARVLWFYLGLILLPRVSEMGLYHDDFVLSHGFFEPLTTLFSVVGWMAIVFILLVPKLRRCCPLVSFAIAWYLWGHVLESTVWPLELVHEHRNYLPSIALICCLAMGLYSIAQFLNLKSWAKYGLIGLPVLILGLATSVRAGHWNSELTHSLMEASNHPESPRAAYWAGQTYINLFKETHNQDFYEQAMKWFRQSRDFSPLGQEMAYVGLLYAPFQIGKYPDKKDIDEYESVLKRSPAIAVNINNLEVLEECQGSGTCKLTHRDFLRLATAVMENPSCPALYKSDVYILLGNYYANVLGDIEQAGAQIRKAVALSPGSLQHSLNWASYLVATGKLDNAQDELKKIEALPDAWKYKTKIDKEMSRIRQFQKE